MTKPFIFKTIGKEILGWGLLLGYVGLGYFLGVGLGFLQHWALSI